MAIQLLTPLPDPPLPTDSEEVFDQKAGIFLTAEQRFANVDINGKLIPGINAAIEQIEASKTAAAGSASAADDSAKVAAKSAGEATTNGAAQVDLAKAQVVIATQQAQLATTNGAAQVALAAEQAALAKTNGQAQVALAADQVAQAAAFKQDTGKIRDSTQIIADAAQTSVGIPSYTDKRGWVITAKEDGSGVEWRPRHRIGEVLQAAGPVGNTFLPLTGGLYLQSAYPELFAKVGLLGAVAGDSWTALSSYPTASASVFSKLVSGKDGVIFSGTNNRVSTVYRSTDGGATWSPIDLSALLGSSAHAIYSIETDKKGVWVVAAYSSTAGTFFSVRSADNGLTWVRNGLPSNIYYSLATDGNGVWVAGNSSGKLFRSSDNALTWQQVYAVGSSSIYGLATDRQGVWIASQASSRPLVSTDNGLTWSAGGDSNAGTIYSVATNGRGLWVIAGSTPSGINAAGISKSYDNGATWTRVTVTGVGSTEVAYSVVTDGADGWYVGMAAGKIVRSVDNGMTWQYVPATQTGYAASAVVSGLLVQGSDLLGTSDGGLVRKSLSVTPYDSTSLFRLPDLPVYKGVTSFIKAKEVAA